MGWTDTTLLFLCSCPCLPGKFAWTHERLLGGNQAEHFPVHICRAHRGGKILRAGCLMSYGQQATSWPQCPGSSLGWEWSRSSLQQELPLHQLPPGHRMWNTVLLRARIVRVGVDLHFVKKNDIRGLVSTSLQFYYLQGPLPSCDALRNSLTHLQSMSSISTVGKKKKGNNISERYWISWEDSMRKF